MGLDLGGKVHHHDDDDQQRGAAEVEWHMLGLIQERRHEANEHQIQAPGR
jgi:hypothetical protein